MDLITAYAYDAKVTLVRLSPTPNPRAMHWRDISCAYATRCAIVIVTTLQLLILLASFWAEAMNDFRSPEATRSQRVNIVFTMVSIEVVILLGAGFLLAGDVQYRTREACRSSHRREAIIVIVLTAWGIFSAYGTLYACFTFFEEMDYGSDPYPSGALGKFAYMSQIAWKFVAVLLACVALAAAPVLLGVYVWRRIQAKTKALVKAMAEAQPHGDGCCDRDDDMKDAYSRLT